MNKLQKTLVACIIGVLVLNAVGIAVFVRYGNILRRDNIITFSFAHAFFQEGFEAKFDRRTRELSVTRFRFSGLDEGAPAEDTRSTVLTREEMRNVLAVVAEINSMKNEVEQQAWEVTLIEALYYITRDDEIIDEELFGSMTLRQIGNEIIDQLVEGIR